MNQLAVGDAVVACGGANALNPQSAVIALARAPVTVGVSKGAIHRLFRRSKQFPFCEKKTFGMLQQCLAPRATLGTAFDSRHGFGLLVRHPALKLVPRRSPGALQ